MTAQIGIACPQRRRCPRMVRSHHRTRSLPGWSRSRFCAPTSLCAIYRSKKSHKDEARPRIPSASHIIPVTVNVTSESKTAFFQMLALVNQPDLMCPRDVTVRRRYVMMNASEISADWGTSVISPQVMGPWKYLIMASDAPSANAATGFVPSRSSDLPCTSKLPLDSRAALFAQTDTPRL